MKLDNDFYLNLGKRIKESRKKLGITQAQLCGDYMTRNMLSRIETGDAHPSMETLLFIAQKLKTPPAYFLCRDAKEEADYTKAIRIKDARRAFGMGQYKKCIDICASLAAADDEVSSMKANSHIMLAISLFDNESIDAALQHLALAEDAIHSTVYMYSEMLSQIRFLHLLAKALAKGAPPKPSEFPSAPPVFFSKDRFIYTLALSAVYHGDERGTCMKELMADGAHRSHLAAKELISNGNAKDAIPLLESALAGSADCYSRYFILVDLESAYRLCEDYKSAYSLAEKRMQLHDKYSKNI